MQVRGVRWAAVVGLSATAVACSSGSAGGPSSPRPTATRHLPPVSLVVVPVRRVPRSELVVVAGILRDRIAGSHLADTSVRVHRGTLRVSVPLDEAQALGGLVRQAGVLAFRQVLDVAGYPHGICTTHVKFPGRSAGDTVACDRSDGIVELLGPAIVTAKGVRGAVASRTPDGQAWQVNLRFTAPGARSWKRLTKTAYAATGSTQSGFGDCHAPRGCNAVAIVLDGVVLSAPAIQLPGGIPGGLADITGNFTQDQAEQLAGVLNSKPFPVPLKVRV